MTFFTFEKCILGLHNTFFLMTVNANGNMVVKLSFSFWKLKREIKEAMKKYTWETKTSRKDNISMAFSLSHLLSASIPSSWWGKNIKGVKGFNSSFHQLSGLFRLILSNPCSYFCLLYCFTPHVNTLYTNSPKVKGCEWRGQNNGSHSLEPSLHSL